MIMQVGSFYPLYSFCSRRKVEMSQAQPRKTFLKDHEERVLSFLMLSEDRITTVTCNRYLFNTFLLTFLLRPQM